MKIITLGLILIAAFVPPAYIVDEFPCPEPFVVPERGPDYELLGDWTIVYPLPEIDLPDTCVR